MAFGKQDNQTPGDFPGQPQPGVVAPINPFGGGNTSPDMQGMAPGGFVDMQGTGTDTSQYTNAAANATRFGMGRDPISGLSNATQGAMSSAMGGSYEDAARQEAAENARLNRPNIQTPFSNSQWMQAPDGTWTLTQGFSSPLAELAGGLQQQAADMGGPMDWAQFGTLGTGEGARQQAIDAAFQQASSRLNPVFAQREEALRERLLNQGLSEGSEAFRNQMDAFGRERNDAMQGALNAAIGQGTQAGQAIFNQNLMGRQQAISEALRRRGQPLQELTQLQGLLRQPGTNQLAAPNLLAALQGQQSATADMVSGGAQLAGALLPFLLAGGN